VSNTFRRFCPHTWPSIRRYHYDLPTDWKQ